MCSSKNRKEYDARRDHTVISVLDIVVYLPHGDKVAIRGLSCSVAQRVAASFAVVVCLVPSCDFSRSLFLARARAANCTSRNNVRYAHYRRTPDRSQFPHGSPVPRGCTRDDPRARSFSPSRDSFNMSTAALMFANCTKARPTFELLQKHAVNEDDLKRARSSCLVSLTRPSAL